jgi:protein-arginine kinase activator protein McsA
MTDEIKELCPFCKKNEVGSFSAVNKKTHEKKYICDQCASTNPAFKRAANSEEGTN